MKSLALEIIPTATVLVLLAELMTVAATSLLATTKLRLPQLQLQRVVIGALLPVVLSTGKSWIRSARFRYDTLLTTNTLLLSVGYPMFTSAHHFAPVILVCSRASN